MAIRLVCCIVLMHMYIQHSLHLPDHGASLCKSGSAA